MMKGLRWHINTALVTGMLLLYGLINTANINGADNQSVVQQIPNVSVDTPSQARFIPVIQQSIEQYIVEFKSTRSHKNDQLYQILKAGLNDHDMEVRAAVASALGTLREESTISDLISTLKDDEMWVRLAAATGLGDIGEKEVIPELLSMLTSNDPHLREAAALSLGAMDYKGEVPGLEDTIKKGGIDPRIASYLHGLSGDIDEEEFRDLKRKIRDKSDIYSRIVAVLAFGKAGNTNDKAVLLVRERLSDEEPIVKAISVVVLGRIGDRESLALIGKLADDPDPIVRGVVALAMGKLGDAETLSGLKRLTRDKEPSVRASAALAIGRLGNIEGVPALEDILLDDNDDNLAVRLMTIASLWKLTR